MTARYLDLLELTPATPQASGLVEVHRSFRDVLSRAGLDPAVGGGEMIRTGFVFFLLGAGLPFADALRFLG